MDLDIVSASVTFKGNEGSEEKWVNKAIKLKATRRADLNFEYKFWQQLFKSCVQKSIKRFQHKCNNSRADKHKEADSEQKIGVPTSTQNHGRIDMGFRKN